MKLLIQKFKKIFYADNCSVCKKKLSEKEIYLCEGCYKYLEKNAVLKLYNNNYYLFYYNEKMKALLGDYKLKNRKGIGREIAKIVKPQIERVIKEKRIDVVIPVPISETRRFERGFNQVEELLDSCDVFYEKIYRTKDTKHMYELKSKDERNKNVESAFNIEIDLEGKRVLIVDDILTTGATIAEIVKSIRVKNQVEEIYIFSLTIAQKFFKEG